MTAQQIRQKFLDFFQHQQHVIRPSSSLLPDNDASVLLTTAGMQQFKPYFLGEKDPVAVLGGKRVTSIQKCFRTSDIEEVGDESHLTFFEMLGNFSFGDYGKKEAIDWAWEFLTKSLKLDKNRLWATVFAGDEEVPGDTEAVKLWAKHLPKERIIALGRKDNFWGPAGDSGPCGPSTEIHWQLDPQKPGVPGDDSGTFIEIWNLVFTEFNQAKDGKLKKLAQLNIDTGMGLERLAMVSQKQPNVFDTDAFKALLDAVSHLPTYGSTGDPVSDGRRQRIIADHIKGACFLLADGVSFSNKDQGYILRRVVRRAADQFLSSSISLDPLVDEILGLYSASYPELKQQERIIRRALADELTQYQKILEVDVATLVKKMRKAGPTEPEHPEPSHTHLTAAEAFTLYATHGLSLDRLARLGFDFHRDEVEQKISKHQEISRAGSKAKFGGHGLAHGPDTAGMSADDVWKVTRLHSATHLLHAALRQILGPTVRQNGSDITPERLRFDFSFDRKLTDEEKRQVENLVNQKITENLNVSWAMVPYQQAIDEGALAFFKEKYGDTVKVYTMGDFSKELCGGPHVDHTEQVGRFTLESEKSVGAGLRRIKASVA